MTAREGMSTLIGRLRAMTGAGTADHVLAGETYFSDDHLQTVLDGTRHTWTRIPLIAMPDLVDGDFVTLQYALPEVLPRWLEENAPASGWALRDLRGALIDPLSYSVNYPAGRITFGADTGGATYTLSCRTYNLYRAASQIWTQKAAFAAADIDWRADNHSLEASQAFTHCQHMAAMYGQLAGPATTVLQRRDEAPRPAAGGKEVTR